MDQTILSLVKENQTDVFFFDPVDGFYCYENSIDAQRKAMLPLFDGYSTNELTKNHGCTLCLMPSEKKKGSKDYVRMKNSLQQYVEPVRQWCPKKESLNYTPNPSRVNEAELNQLIQMLQEQGIMAWIKRTFKLGGYSSRAEMALELCQKIEDACAFCDVKIAAIETRAETDRNAQVTETRRKMATENERYTSARRQAESSQKEEKEQALIAIGKFDTSLELQNMHSRLAQMRAAAENSCGVWGEYTIPSDMPEQVLLCEGKLSLPNAHGR